MMLARKRISYNILDEHGGCDGGSAPLSPPKTGEGRTRNKIMRRKRVRIGLEKKQGKEDAINVEKMRKLSRQEYLKKRAKKKLDEVRDEIEDEEYLFPGVEITEKQRKKKEIYELVREKIEEFDCFDEYKMPESYDEQGRENQRKRLLNPTQSRTNGRIAKSEEQF